MILSIKENLCDFFKKNKMPCAFRTRHISVTPHNSTCNAQFTQKVHYTSLKAVANLLELYAQEIVDLLCETLGRSIIITDTEPS